MSTIVLRAAKATPLTHGEVDANFTNLNNDKLEIGSVQRDGNTVVGFEALGSNLTGTGTVAVGHRALRVSTTGNNNTATGYEALYSNTGGSNNTALGFRTLFSNASGSNNTALGSSALYSNASGSNSTANGLGALQFSTTASNNTAFGAYSLYFNTTGSGNTALGQSALVNCTTGSGNLGFGGVNSAEVYEPVFNLTTENNRVAMGSSAVTNAYIQVAWTVVSDARDKTNFGTVPHGLAFINALKPTAFQFKESRTSTETNGPVRYGFLAQDILGLEGPGSVIIDAEDPEKLRYNGESLVPVMVNAIQELTSMVNAMQAELSTLKGASK
jgi:hypothetical protein